jgi:lipopolysaccharide transport system ATP-binding protein
MSEVLIKTENVSKKFCKDLKRSMLYGIQDIALSSLGITPKTDSLKTLEFWAVDDVSFSLRRGECLGLVGPNGSGKSTLLKILNGIITPDIGRVEIHGKVGALIEIGAGFHPMLTGRENIYISGAVLGFSKKEIDRKFDAIVDFAELEDFIDTSVKHYSSGMYVRLGFAIAAQMEPDVLLIDEVLAVGDIGFRAKCFNAINRIIKNAAVIFVSHAMPEVSRICTDICVLNKGMVAFQGKDVPKGIESYYSAFETEKNMVIGSGKATVHSIILESNGKRDINSITYLDDLTFHVEVSIEPSIKYPCIGIFFMNQTLQIVAQCHSYYNRYKINNNGKTMRISISLGAINLNPGVYTLSMGIQAENIGEVLVRHINFRTLKVKGHFFGQAPVQMNGAWAVQEID